MKPNPEIRRKRSTRRVLLVLLSGAPRLGGFTICRSAMVGSGTLYPLLERLEHAGWVAGEWQQDTPAGQPRRRFYHLTLKGRTQALRMLGLEMPGA